MRQKNGNQKAWIWATVLLITGTVMVGPGRALLFSPKEEKRPRGESWASSYQKNQRSMDLVMAASVESAETERECGPDEGRSPASVGGIDFNDEWMDDTDLLRDPATGKRMLSKRRLKRAERCKKRLPLLRAAANLKHRDPGLASQALVEMTKEIPSDQESTPSEKGEDLQTMMWTYLAASDGSQDLVESVAPSILSQSDTDHQQMMFCEFSRFYPEERDSLSANLRSKGVVVGGCGSDDEYSGREVASVSGDSSSVHTGNGGEGDTSDKRQSGDNPCPGTGDLAEYRCLTDPASSPVVANIVSLNSTAPNVHSQEQRQQGHGDLGASGNGPAAVTTGPTPNPAATPTPTPVPTATPSPSPSPSPTPAPTASPSPTPTSTPTPRPTGSPSPSPVGSGSGSGS